MSIDFAPQPAVRIRDLTKAFGPVPVLRGLDLDVPSGCVVAVLGPSGCGKTTLLRIVAGFAVADSGAVSLGGQLVQGGTVYVPARRRGVGYVAQEGALFPHLSVADNISFGLSKSGLRLRRRTHAHRIDELLDLVGLDRAVRSRRPHQLSGGQQQRVALARALAPVPSVVLLDEPFSSLDATLREETGRATLEALRTSGASAILVTHDQAEALSLANQVVVMHDGRILQVGAPRDVYERPVSSHIAQLVGQAIVLAAQCRDGIARCALGPLPIGDSNYVGDCEVVLRPEQLVFADDGVPAVVLDTAYYGHDCLVYLKLTDGGIRVAARHDGGAIPPAGTTVYLRVQGQVTSVRPTN